MKNRAFDWILQEERSLLEHYDKDFSFDSKIDYYYTLTSFIAHYRNRDDGHFISFSKIDNSWYLFDDLSKEPTFKIGDFKNLKILINQNWKINFGYNIFTSKLRICFCFYERIKYKGYENYIQTIKKIFGNW